MNIVIDRDWRSVTVDGREVHVGPTEYAILLALDEKDGYVSSKALVSQVRINPDDLKVYVKRLRQKLGSEAILNSRGFGYALHREKVQA